MTRGRTRKGKGTTPARPSVPQSPVAQDSPEQSGSDQDSPDPGPDLRLRAEVAAVASEIIGPIVSQQLAELSQTQQVLKKDRPNSVPFGQFLTFFRKDENRLSFIVKKHSRYKSQQIWHSLVGLQ